MGNCPVVYWLRLHTFTAKGAGSIPGQGTKIPQHSPTDKNKQKQPISYGSRVPKLNFHTPRKLCALPASCHRGPALRLRDVRDPRHCVGTWVLSQATRAPATPLGVENENQTRSVLITPQLGYINHIFCILCFFGCTTQPEGLVP